MSAQSALDCSMPLLFCHETTETSSAHSAIHVTERTTLVNKYTGVENDGHDDDEHAVKKRHEM